MDTSWSRILSSHPLKYNSVSSFGLMLQNQIKAIVIKTQRPRLQTVAIFLAFLLFCLVFKMLEFFISIQILLFKFHVNFISGFKIVFYELT